MLLNLLAIIASVDSFWIPSYDVNLHQSETFVISDLSGSDDFYQDEDEMIPTNELKSGGDDDDKLFRLHRMAKAYNSKERNSWTKSESDFNQITERNFDREDPIPWQAGFVDKNGKLLKYNGDTRNVYYVNEMAKDLIEAKIDEKRQEQVIKVENITGEKEVNYDYVDFQKEYTNQIVKAQKKSDTLNFTEIEENESPEEALELLVDFKGPRNCTAEEAKGIGFGTLKCFWGEAKKTHTKTGMIRILERMSKIFLVWFFFWLIFAIPCWCQRGWCCCCCCCRCCKPRKVLDEAKKFYVNNPPGVYHNDNGQKLTYKATHYEKYAQKRLESALMSL